MILGIDVQGGLTNHVVVILGTDVQGGLTNHVVMILGARGI